MVATHTPGYIPRTLGFTPVLCMFPFRPSFPTYLPYFNSGTRCNERSLSYRFQPDVRRSTVGLEHRVPTVRVLSVRQFMRVPSRGLL